MTQQVVTLITSFPSVSAPGPVLDLGLPKCSCRTSDRADTALFTSTNTRKLVSSPGYTRKSQVNNPLETRFSILFSQPPCRNNSRVVPRIAEGGFTWIGQNPARNFIVLWSILLGI